MTSTAKVPVTVLTGFLGSGKTTLLNRILSENHGQRIAVIENEFGEIPIDDALVLRGDEEIFELSNGCCLCCTARTDLVRMLHTLLDRPGRFDRIVIETTGMADPNPVAQTFFVDEVISSQIELDAIVTMVDAKHVGAHLDEVETAGVGDIAFDQIAFADKIVLNKTDLVSEAELSAVERRLRSINAAAEILRSEHAKVSLDAILGVGAFDLSRTMAVDPDWLNEEHVHDPSLESVGIEFDGDLDRVRLDTWLAELLADHGDEIYRLKGIVALEGDTHRAVLQGIHRLYEVRSANPWGLEPRRNKIVFIGRELDRGTLTQGLHGCLAA